ncbi:hypothetical protein BC831DRAFT_461561 [Entophlyctis helioformis]|nr:hypothetical protein BC831DRAFT_461561 [Entophlyctis helioformis]
MYAHGRFMAPTLGGMGIGGNAGVGFGGNAYQATSGIAVPGGRLRGTGLPPPVALSLPPPQPASNGHASTYAAQQQHQAGLPKLKSPQQQFQLPQLPNAHGRVQGLHRQSNHNINHAGGGGGGHGMYGSNSNTYGSASHTQHSRTLSSSLIGSSDYGSRATLADAGRNSTSLPPLVLAANGAGTGAGTGGGGRVAGGTTTSAKRMHGQQSQQGQAMQIAQQQQQTQQQQAQVQTQPQPQPGAMGRTTAQQRKLHRGLFGV